MSDVKVAKKKLIKGSIEPGYRVVCKTCGYRFFVSEANKIWYEQNNMVMPKKCWHCRRKNKEKAAKAENGEA